MGHFLRQTHFPVSGSGSSAASSTVERDSIILETFCIFAHTRLPVDNFQCIIQEMRINVGLKRF